MIFVCNLVIYVVYDSETVLEIIGLLLKLEYHECIYSWFWVASLCYGILFLEQYTNPCTYEEAILEGGRKFFCLIRQTVDNEMER